MSKKHFIKLAKIFSKYALQNNVMASEILKDVCELCKEENPNFDENRFLKACGVNE